jgi:hypothetical protein
MFSGMKNLCQLYLLDGLGLTAFKSFHQLEQGGMAALVMMLIVVADGENESDNLIRI